MDTSQPSPQQARVAPASGGLPAVTLQAPDGARALLYLQGAHVASWSTPDGRERLFLSTRSPFHAGAAIRGGVPVVFPQFSSRGPLPKHGFARTTPWELTAMEETRSLWPHPFLAELTVHIGGSSLSLRLDVTNTGPAAFPFTAALHTYLRVADLEGTRVVGLRGLTYEDNAAGGRRDAQPEEELSLRGEVDRVYLDAPGTLEVREPGATVEVRKEGFRDVVVWNPGAERGATLADLEPGGYARFVCVEAGCIGTPVMLHAGERWSGTQTLTAR